MIRNLAEEFSDFLDSPTWYSIVEMLRADSNFRRCTLMTSLTINDVQRAGHIYTLAAYKALCSRVYETAGRKLPSELRELFTGSPRDD